MNLVNVTLAATLVLPDALFWSDEFRWVRVVRTAIQTITGAQDVQEGVKLAGRPITLEPPAEDMAWVTRADVQILKNWAETAGTILRLELTYPTDTRMFNVIFRAGEEAIEASPVRGFDGEHDANAEWTVKIKLMEI
jgi:hypothetical protein